MNVQTYSARLHQKSVLCTHLHAYFQSTFHTQVHKNLCTCTCACTGAHTHTNGLLSRVIPRFSFEIDEKFYPFWTDLIQSYEKRNCHIYPHATKHYVFYWTPYQFKILQFCYYATAENSGFFNQHSELRSHCWQQFTCIKWSCFDTKTADNCGILTQCVYLGSHCSRQFRCVTLYELPRTVASYPIIKKYVV